MPGNPLLRGRSSTSNNRAGANGTDNGNWPEDDVLRHALHQYAGERLTRPQRLRRLQDEFGLRIGETTLKQLNKHFAVPSPRKPPPKEVSQQLVLNEMDKDPAGRRGPSTVMSNLAIQGTPVPRDFIREVMQTTDPGGAEARYPGKKVPTIPRKTLTAQGPLHQLHCDGHEKLNAKALKMGDVGIDIYAYRDQYSGAILYCRAVPNARKADAIGHVYLDYIEEYKAIPTTLVFDKGSETGWQYSIQRSLKDAYCDDPVLADLPATIAIKSVHNTPIENIWHWFRQNRGRDLVDIIKSGADFFNPNDALHLDLFYWIWPSVIQAQLDEFRTYWNCHRVRSQAAKAMPSGTTPNMVYISPEAFGGQRMGIIVPVQHVIGDLRALIKTPKEEVFRWVSDEFCTEAQQVYELIGSPTLDPFSAWGVFTKMEGVFRGD